MYHTGGLFAAGIPWALGVIFGAWGFRPGANRVTNVLAIVALVLGLFLAVVTTIASVVYGLGYSD
jgi:preprotein translocase subunit SecG